MTSLGTTAYVGDLHYENLIPHPSLATPDLQNVTTQGHTTTTHINMNGGDLILSNGDVEATLGKVTAGSDISSTAGNIETLAGHIQASSHLEAGSYVRAGSHIDAITGDITATAGNITATVGDITATDGHLIANGSGSVSVLGTGHISAVSGDIFTNTGDIIATAGDIKALGGGVEASAGHSKFNRMQFMTDYGGTTFALPVSLTNVAPYNNFTLPNGTHNFVIFCKGVVGSATFPLELFTSYTDLLKDYTIKVDFQTCDNAGNPSLGFNNIVIGHAQSAPLDTSKITILVNSTLVYAAPTIVKISINLEYSPSP